MDLTYRLSYNKEWLAVTGGEDLEGKLAIPSEDYYQGKIYPVIAIGDSAFSDCSALTSIVINDTSLLKWARVPEGVEIVTP